MRNRLIHHLHSTALLVGGLLLAGCASNPPATTLGAETNTASPASPASPAPAAPAAPRTQGRHGKIRNRAANLAAKDAVSTCGLPNNTVYRLILTKNDDENDPPCPVAATAAEKSALGDPWAQQILLKNVFPTSVADIVTQMASFGTPASFVLGEGSQIPLNVADRNASRDLRYVVSWNSTNPTVFLSAAPGTHSSFLQVVAWDASKKWFNFYEYNDDTLVWSWAGNSSYALQPDTQGHGCFDCHHNGIPIMKELELPWNNWHSNKAAIADSVVPQEVANEPLFQRKSTADVFEGFVKGAQSAFHPARIQGLVVGNQINGVPELLGHIISQSTVNLVSSGINSAGTGDVTVPLKFFVRSELTAILFPDPNKPLNITTALPRKAYNAFLTTHKYQLVQSDGSQYSMPGSTNFAFLVPAYSADDSLITNTLVNTTGMVDAKFEVSVMMVDFQNPVFSAVREGLLQYANQIKTGNWASETATVSDVPAQFAKLVTQAAKSQPACNPAQLDACTAEQQFLYFYSQTGDAWKTDAAKRIQAYATSVSNRIGTTDGVSDYMRLAASRQAQMKNSLPIGNLVEFSLLFPQSDLPNATLRMHVDGTVGAN